MKVKEMREKSVEELNELLIETRKKQFSMRMQTGFGQEARASEIRAARKDVARIKTLLAELRNGGGS
jgi:large subunit ribosomal protein L29